VLLLGSVATGKYRDILLDIFGEKLVFPEAFVGRGDMSRGALLLRAAQAGQPLIYQQVSGAVLNGKRAGAFQAVALSPQKIAGDGRTELGVGHSAKRKALDRSDR
jgi:hypothetical protein